MKRLLGTWSLVISYRTWRIGGSFRERLADQHKWESLLACKRQTPALSNSLLAGLVDVGCGWGRWTIAAARAGFRPIGLDVHIDALAPGVRVLRQLDVRADYVCREADRLPFPSASVDFVFSYSLLQHLEKSAVMRFFSEVSRVLKPKGVCLVQLPNVLGLHNMLQQAKRGFREGRSGTFEMRYWSTKAIRQAVEMAGLKDMAIRPEGFFTQNPQLSDLDLLSPKGKMIVLVSNAGRKLAAMFPIVTGLADSFWVEARVR